MTQTFPLLQNPTKKDLKFLVYAAMNSKTGEDLSYEEAIKFTAYYMGMRASDIHAILDLTIPTTAMHIRNTTAIH